MTISSEFFAKTNRMSLIKTNTIGSTIMLEIIN